MEPKISRVVSNLVRGRHPTYKEMRLCIGISIILRKLPVESPLPHNFPSLSYIHTSYLPPGRQRERGENSVCDDTFVISVIILPLPGVIPDQLPRLLLHHPHPPLPSTTIYSSDFSVSIPYIISRQNNNRNDIIQHFFIKIND